MPTTVQEILRQTGFSESEIQQIDQRAVNAFGGVLTQAQEAREAAELAQRSNVKFYEESVVPALTSWESERTEILNARAKAEAEAAFYRAQNETARTGGFIPSDAPGYQPRDGQSGRYVAATQGGSPTFEGGIEQLRNDVGTALGTLSDIQWRYQSLYNAPMPISPTELTKRASASGLSAVDFAAREFKFAEKEGEIARKRQEDHDAAIRSEAIAETDRRWSERVGSNPDLRAAVPSPNVEIARAVQKGTRPDPILLTDQQRHSATAQQIRERISQQES